MNREEYTEEVDDNIVAGQEEPEEPEFDDKEIEQEKQQKKFMDCMEGVHRALSIFCAERGFFMNLNIDDLYYLVDQ